MHSGLVWWSNHDRVQFGSNAEPCGPPAISLSHSRLIWGRRYHSDLGVVVVVGSKRVNQLIWAAVLIVAVYLGGGMGGLLMSIGGLVGLLSRYVQ
jgi:hypothetical protein